MTQQSHVSPVLDCPLVSGEDVVYCASLALAWRELTARYGPLRMDPQPVIADALNEPLDPSVIDSACCVVGAGFGAEGIVERLAQQFAERFPAERAGLLPSSMSPDGLLAYAFLGQALPFRTAFATRTTTFAGRMVAAFGLSGTGPVERTRAMQVVLHDFASPHDFVLELVPEDTSDKILVAQVAPQPTLRATVAAVLERRGRLGRDAASLRDDESLAIPCVTLDSAASFSDVVGRPLLNVAGKCFDDVRQTVRFTLDERGAIVRSEAVLQSYGPPPRAFHVTKPFLVMLLRSGATAPYLAAWIETTTWMTDRGEIPPPPVGWA